MTVTYPSDEITPVGQWMLHHSGNYPAYWVDSPNGNVRFHLMGGLAPWPGLQDGVVCEALRSYDPPFDLLDSQGAHQDGVTNNDTVYGATEIDFVLKTVGRSLHGARKAFDDWLDSWDPKHLCKLTRFTEVDGHWWCYVRKSKPLPDDMTIRNRGQKLTWTARNDQTFWQSTPSVCEFHTAYASDTDGFNRTSIVNLGAGWIQTYSGTGAGTCATPNGFDASWIDSGGGVRAVRNYRVGYQAATDNVIVQEQHTTFVELPLGGDAYNDLIARWDGGGNYIRARFSNGSVMVSKFIDGVQTDIGQIPTLFLGITPPSIQLQCGTDDGPRNYVPMINGSPVGTISETGGTNLSRLGPGFRGAGFGMQAGTRVGGGQTTPSNVGQWTCNDNLAVAQTGFQTLTNRGDQPAWASHLVYGPAAEIAIGDGPGSTTMIKFGPLEAGQIALITTLPRLRSVVDLSPKPVVASSQNLDLFQTIVKDFVDLASAGNVPPLLAQIENFFGIRPPQGVLYSLLNGRFSNPIPRKPEGLDPVESHIAVSIKGGNADSKIISSVTPLRRMPVQ